MGVRLFGHEGRRWINEPRSWSADAGLTVTADPDTDSWRATHHGYDRDSGHLLGVPVIGDEEPVNPLRLAHSPPDVPALVGVMAAAPTGVGFTVRFDRIQVTSA